MYELMIESTFDAAHALRGYEGPCENLHGHTWRVQIFLKGNKLNKIGYLKDFKDIKKTLKIVLSQFDHKNLNETARFIKINPSCENLSLIIYKEMKRQIKELTKVTVWESATTSATYSPK